MSTRAVIGPYGLWMAALTGAYYLAPQLQLYVWTAIGLSAAAAVALGVIIHRPRRRAPWVLVALALVIFTTGDTVYLVLTDVFGQSNPFPSLADVFYLAMYPLLAAGMLLLPRSATGRNRAGLLDVLVFTAGVLLLTWIFLISRYLENSAMGPLEKATSIAYPLSDVLVLAVGIWLISAVPRSPTVIWLAVGGVFLLVTDVVYGLSQLSGEWNMGSGIDIGWIVFYASWGAAALHSSMVQLTEPRIVRESDVTKLRMSILAASALIAPAVIFVEDSFWQVQDGEVIGALCALIFMLVLLRLAGLVQQHHLAETRERGLSEAGAELVSASDVDAVAAAVRNGVAKLLEPGTRHEVLLSQHDPVSAQGLVPIEELSSTAAARLSGFEIALVQPLTLTERNPGRPLIGTLIVAADDANLLNLRRSAEVLATKAALAIERITLGNEIARRKTEEYFRALVHHSADVIIILDEGDRIRYASPAAVTVFGEATRPGQALGDLIHPNHRELAGQVLDLVRSGHDDTGVADWSVLRRDGETVEVEVSCRDLRSDATVKGLVVTLRDVTDRRRLERELTHRAFHDPLTGLANRALFSDRVMQAVARARHTETIVGVLFIDLDDFKVVNDTLGHETGDQMLAVVGERLAAALRSNDIAARLGGDEFAVLIENTHDPRDIELVAERLVHALAEPVALGASLVSTSASIGVATTIDAAAASELLRQADLALYVAKGAGKGRWRRYQSVLHTAIVERLELRSALDKAVAEGAFALQYQPIVALDMDVTVGFEALVRWRHATRGLLAPGEFIDVAEESGLIVPIGYWVVQRALTDALAWSGLAESAYVSVNVSARQFRTPGFVETIQAQLAASSLPPERFMLEITESLLVREDEQVWSDLMALRQAGVRVAIDDFGTGYSSLSYLRQVPVDVVKIDKSFIDTMADSAQQLALVEGIVRLAHTLGLQVVAEGVQRADDRDHLIEIGCALGQGYLFAGPLDHAEVMSWLEAERVAA